MPREIAIVARKFKLGDPTPDRESVAYWLSRPPYERLLQVEELRRLEHGVLPRLERVARVIKPARG